MKFLFSRGRVLTAFSLQFALLGFHMVSSPVALANEDFDDCVVSILNSGLSEQEAGEACADALDPENLGECVEKITEKTAISGADALQNCYLVRRPRDLSKCVVDINKDVLDEEFSDDDSDSVAQSSDESQDSSLEQSSEESLEESSVVVASESLLFALDTCRRSLLPLRHSECVIGISTESENLPPTQVMEICISAQTPAVIFPLNRN